MTKEKQIEEMQTVINRAFFADFKNRNGVCIKTISEHLHNAGYRKASSVAEEIFAEIEKHLVTGTTFYGEAIHIIGIATFAKLKKKYTETEGGENDKART